MRRVDHRGLCLCGALDCPHCYPELQEIIECDCCGAEFPRWMNWEDRNGHILCEECADKVQCEECGEWFDSDEVDNGICKGCLHEKNGDEKHD